LRLGSSTWKTNLNKGQITTVIPTLPAATAGRMIKTLPVEVKYLVFGDSLVNLVPTDDIPADIAIDSYSGSTSVSKLNILDDYSETEQKSITIQDGTNTLTRESSEKTVNEHFADYKDLITAVTQKFSPERIFLCQVPPVNHKKDSDKKNARIREFNDLLSDDAAANSKIDLIPLYYYIVSTVSDLSECFYDDVHFNFALGIPIIKNCLLGKLIPYSNNKPRALQKPDQRYPSQRGGPSWNNIPRFPQNDRSSAGRNWNRGEPMFDRDGYRRHSFYNGPRQGYM
jgi:hypothetical protein